MNEDLNRIKLFSLHLKAFGMVEAGSDRICIQSPGYLMLISQLIRIQLRFTSFITKSFLYKLKCFAGFWYGRIWFRQNLYSEPGKSECPPLC